MNVILDNPHGLRKLLDSKNQFLGYLYWYAEGNNVKWGASIKAKSDVMNREEGIKTAYERAHSQIPANTVFKETVTCGEFSLVEIVKGGFHPASHKLKLTQSLIKLAEQLTIDDIDKEIVSSYVMEKVVI